MDPEPVNIYITVACFVPFGGHAGDIHLVFLLSLCTVIDSTAMTCDSEETCLCLVVVATSPFESVA